MKKMFLSLLVTPIFLSVWLSSTHTLAQTINPCELYSKADAEALLNEKVSAGETRDAITPAGKSCLYKFVKEGGVYSLKVRVSDDLAIKDEGIFDSAAAVMARQEKARKKNNYAAKRFEKIPHLGDDAFWTGTSLWLRKGQTLVKITVNAPLEGSFPSKEALNNAKMNLSKTLSLKAAETIAGRLK